MNLPYFIAKRIVRNRHTSFSRFVIRLATVGTALSVAVMIIAVAVVLGFKEQVKEKMFVFWGHIEITEFNPNPASVIAPTPFAYNPALLHKIRSMPGVVSAYPYIVKPAILQSGKSMEGIKLKGVDASYPLMTNNGIRFSGSRLSFPDKDYAQQVILSEATLNRLEAHIGDTIRAYFLNADDQAFPRIRKLSICGTYHTGMEEIDKSFGLCDMRLLQRVSNWNGQAINGYQVSVADYTRADIIGDSIYHRYLEPPLNRSTMQDIYPNVFNWLALMNTNAYIILIIMAIVAAINMTTALLIFIMERTNMVGILKTLGMRPIKIQWVFIYHAATIAGKGIVYGTLAGVGFCLAQQYGHIIRLDEGAYYMQYAPVRLNAWYVVLIDLATLLFCIIVMLLPSLLVRKISIIRAIRFK